MTDRHAGYIVTLERDMREDDAEESVLIALRMIRGVASVDPIVSGPELHMAYERARFDLRGRMQKALEE